MDTSAVLRDLRENTGDKQREFALRAGIDQSRVSRIESGGVSATEKDIELWLGASRPEDRQRAETYLRTPWRAVGEVAPLWNHPDLAELAAVATALGRLESDMPDSILSSARRYREVLIAAFRSLRSLSYRVSLMGASAVGKSTAESHGLDLRTPAGEMILPTGGGNTTLCEMLIDHGEPDRWGIVVEPESTDEVRRLVEDLCAPFQPSWDVDPKERPRVPPEVRIALLNMAGLGAKPEKRPDGRFVRRDPIEHLAQVEGEHLLSALLIKLRLAERQQTELWWDSSVGGEPQAWLRDNLVRINKGLHPVVPLPRRIRLILGRPIFAEGPYAVTVIDSRGIVDDVVRRPDLAEALTDPRTMTVACSSFLRAPDLYVRHLLGYCHEQEFSMWKLRLAVLTLVHSEEPKKVQYEDTGECVLTDEEGLLIKEAQARQQLVELNSGDVTLASYDAFNDPPLRFQSVVISRIEAVRHEEKRRAADTVAAAIQLLDTARQDAVQNARRAVANSILDVLATIETSDVRTGLPQDSSLQQVELAHPASVWAMVRRRGRWRSLSLDLHLSDGAALVARTRSADAVIQIKVALDALASQPDLKEAQSLVQQFRDTTEKARQDFVSRVRSTAEATVWSPMHADLTLWAECGAEWGRGAGYRSRVSKRLENWFRQNGGYVDDFLRRLKDDWRDSFITPILDLCSSSDGVEKSSSGAGA